MGKGQSQKQVFPLLYATLYNHTSQGIKDTLPITDDVTIVGERLVTDVVIENNHKTQLHTLSLHFPQVIGCLYVVADDELDEK